MKSGIVFAKRMLKKKIINLGLIDPAAKGRHGLVGEIELADMKRQFQISFLKAYGLLPEHKFLDFGCGTLRGGIPIIEYLNGGNYYGLDVRANVLIEARQELLENGLDFKSPLLLDMQRAKLHLEGIKFDCIWAFSVLIHMDDYVFKDTVQFVARHLKDDGVFYANVNIGKVENREWQGFPVITRPLTFYEREVARHGLKVKVLGSLESLGHISGREQQDQQIMLEISHL